MNSDRVLIVAVPLFVAVLVHVVFLVAIEGEWNKGEATVVAKPQVVQAALVSLNAPKKRHLNLRASPRKNQSQNQKPNQNLNPHQILFLSRAR